MGTQIKKCTIISGAPDDDIDFLKENIDVQSFIICADSGYKNCLKAGFTPNLIIGDFDSSEKPDINCEIISLEVEKAYRDVQFRVGDKKHQLECMALLQDLLPDYMRQEKINYIKANTVVDKAVSNYFGFPKMIKKIEMNKDMLEVRENVLNDYLKLFEVLQDNHEIKEVLYKKYAQPKLIEGDA